MSDQVAMTPGSDGDDDVTRWPGAELVEATAAATAAVMPSVVEDLSTLVRIPSISAKGVDEVVASAEAVADLFARLGFDVAFHSSPRPDGRDGAPAVIARRAPVGDAPTIMLYAHHDVQPPGPASEWSTTPFEPTRQGERLYGRGAADDKAGVMAHVGALRVLAELAAGDDGDPTGGVGIVLFVEGEEEVGSPSFARFLDEHVELLESDVIVVADSVNWKVGVPALTTSLRGLADLTIELDVLEHAVHSGMFGGPIIDALTALCQLLATLHTPEGDVAVNGLVQSSAANLDYPDAQFRADASILPGVHLAGTGSLTERLWAKPAISVLAIDAPAVADASNTLVPRARAKVSLRTAPGQDPQEALTALIDHLHAHAPFGARVTISDTGQGHAFQAPADSTAMAAARWAFKQAWGTPPVDIGVGGSIPFITELLTRYPNAAIVVTGVEDPDSRAHGANESVHLGELAKAVHAEALLICALGTARPNS